MAKEKHTPETPSSSGATLAILVVGIILVAALIVWAMTRTVEPETTTAAATDTPPPAAAPVTPSSTTTPGSPALAPPIAAATPAGQPAAPQGDKAAVTRIAAEDLRAKMNRNEVTILDVRDGAAFATEHIPGAISTPFASLEAQIDTLPKGKPIVTYCT
jgi:hypothetical protein